MNLWPNLLLPSYQTLIIRKFSLEAAKLGSQVFLSFTFFFFFRPLSFWAERKKKKNKREKLIHAPGRTTSAHRILPQQSIVSFLPFFLLKRKRKKEETNSVEEEEDIGPTSKEKTVGPISSSHSVPHHFAASSLSFFISMKWKRKEDRRCGGERMWTWFQGVGCNSSPGQLSSFGLFKVKTRAWRLHPNTRNQAMGMLEVTCVPAIMEETLIREYTVNLPTPFPLSFLFLTAVLMTWR